MKLLVSASGVVLLVGLVAMFAGCEGGSAYDHAGVTNPESLVGVWEQTDRVVNGVAEHPITVPLTYGLLADGTYWASDGADYSESGTWWADGPNLILNMNSNSLEQPTRQLVAGLEVTDPTHFTLSYTSTVGTVSQDIVETFEASGD